MVKWTLTPHAQEPFIEQKAGAQISQRAFIQSLVILFVLMMIAGILSLIIPAGQYTGVELDGILALSGMIGPSILRIFRS